MANRTCSEPSNGGELAIVRSPDFDLIDLVDALVACIDAGRTTEIDQLRFALEPFGGVHLFDAELRLNGAPSVPEFCLCGSEEL